MQKGKNVLPFNQRGTQDKTDKLLGGCWTTAACEKEEEFLVKIDLMMPAGIAAGQRPHTR